MAPKAKKTAPAAPAPAPAAAPAPAPAPAPTKKAAVAPAAPAAAAVEESKTVIATRVSEEDVRKAVTVLLKHSKANSRTSNDLLGSDEQVMLIIGLRKVPSRGSNNPKLIPLAHSLYKHSPDAQFCLFAKDPADSLKETFTTTPVQGLVKVMGFTKLKKNFSQYKERRELCESYDAFFCDERILTMMPQVLGKVFYEKKKQPIPVRVARGTARFAVEKARDSTCLFLGWGPCTTVRVGNTAFSADELVENIVTALPAIVDKIPRKWTGIRSIHLKTPKSVALPLFAALPELRELDPAMLDDTKKYAEGVFAASASKNGSAAAGDDDDNDDDEVKHGDSEGDDDISDISDSDEDEPPRKAAGKAAGKPKAVAGGKPKAAAAAGKAAGAGRPQSAAAGKAAGSAARPTSAPVKRAAPAANGAAAGAGKKQRTK